MSIVGTIHEFEYSSTGFVCVISEEGDVGKPNLRPAFSPPDWHKPLEVVDYNPETEEKLGERYRATYEELGLCFPTPTADG